MRPHRLDEDSLAEAARHLRRSDPKLGAVVRRVGPCAVRPAGRPYRYLVRSVLYQQLAGSAARAIERRLHAHFGGAVPEPGRLAAAEPEELRALGLSRQKIAALRSVAEAFRSGRIRERSLFARSDEEVIAEVTQIRGVGEWTAHMLLMFSLGRPDVLPVGDYGVRKAAQRLYRLRELPRRERLEQLGEAWRPYRSVAAWYLWRSLEA
jgi:DNA-3-methyladenine glycosylase II